MNGSFPSICNPHHIPNVRTRTILVIEDEAAIRNLLLIILQRMGYNVLEAGDGAEGLTVSRKFSDQIDLVIADIREWTAQRWSVNYKLSDLE